MSNRRPAFQARTLRVIGAQAANPRFRAAATTTAPATYVARQRAGDIHS